MFPKRFDRLLTPVSSNTEEIRKQALKITTTAYRACKGNKHFFLNEFTIVQCILMTDDFSWIWIPGSVAFLIPLQN